MMLCKEDIDALSLAEKQALFEMLRKSINEDLHMGEADENEAELQILQQKLEEYKENPSSAMSWEDVIDILNDRKKWK
jgi:putative addiction module component (TIGR02574 family)